MMTNSFYAVVAGRRQHSRRPEAFGSTANSGISCPEIIDSGGVAKPYRWIGIAAFLTMSAAPMAMAQSAGGQDEAGVEETVAPAAPAAPVGASAAAGAAAPAGATPGTPMTLPQVTVTGVLSTGDSEYYNALDASSILRTDAPLKETPLSLDVTTEKELRDRQVTTLDEALRNDASVQISKTTTVDKTYQIRGFDANVTSDGLGGISSSTPIEGVQRIEVVKGPDVIEGGGGLGGTINLVRKKPVAEPLREVTLGVADGGEFKQTLDVGGALDDSGSISSRFIFSRMRSEHSEAGFDGERDLYVAPSLGWRTDDLNLIVGAEYNKEREAPSASTVALEGKVVDLPGRRHFPRDDHYETESRSLYYDLDWDVSRDWAFNSKAQLGHSENTYQGWDLSYAGTGICFPDELVGVPFGGVCSGNRTNDLTSRDTWSLRNQLNGRVSTGFVTHHLLLGYDVTHEESERESIPFSEGNYRSYPNVSVFDTSSYDLLDAPARDRVKQSENTNVSRNLVLQDQLDVGEDLHILINLKRSQRSTDGTRFTMAGERLNSSQPDVDDWLASYGVSYDVSDDTTVYANHLNSLGRIQFGENGEPLPPLDTESQEVGFKSNLYNDALTFNAAVFRNQQANIPLYQGPNRDEVTSLTTIKSRGVELSLSGEPLPGWGVSASYTRLWFDDNFFAGQSDELLNLWSRYRIQSGRLEGYGGAVGVSAYAGMQVEGFNRFRLPGGASTDVSLFKEIDNYSVTLGVTNLFDRDLYSSMGSLSRGSYIPLQPGREWRLTASYSF